MEVGSNAGGSRLSFILGLAVDFLLEFQPKVPVIFVCYPMGEVEKVVNFLCRKTVTGKDVVAQQLALSRRFQPGEASLYLKQNRVVFVLSNNHVSCKERTAPPVHAQ